MNLLESIQEHFSATEAHQVKELLESNPQGKREDLQNNKFERWEKQAFKKISNEYCQVKEQIREFDKPPEVDGEERRRFHSLVERYTTLSQWLDILIYEDIPVKKQLRKYFIKNNIDYGR